MTNNIIPTLKYKDAKSAITWLQNVLGFQLKLIVEQDNQMIAHAQLTYNDMMVMLSSAGSSDFDKKVKLGPQAVYIVVDDVDYHYELASKHDLKLVWPLVDQEYGGRGYSCQDPEGNVWSFGTYNPWTD